ncbi:hypothetical protein V6N11_052309 [Hibiscus sabdariffa]|uniref:PQ-loop repeat family protein / transmembrane family protein n=1 Tax=Hibiscus sabdariffa TaxID=183260 RepID=A0ABR2U9L8_9ROSI
MSGECWEWAKVYSNDCICSRREQVSFGLGLVSVLSWGVAEIPQIITNYKEKSVQGLSLGFLITWIIGDLFNLFGCILEPATLPTQFYIAVLYTMTTLILAAQTVYYAHIYPRVCNKDSKEYRSDGSEKIRENINNFRAKQVTDAAGRLSSPIPLPSHREFVPPSTSTKPLLCLMSALMFISLFNFQLSAVNGKTNKGFVIQVGRKLLQANTVSSGERGSAEGSTSSRVGSFLGWAMAAIYMGGRLPQIYLNIRRGNVEGLNPFMFVFALVGNSTYVASILVRSMDWSRIQPNLPWLVDAGGCVLLDAFIVIQFIYFCKWAAPDAEVKHETPWEDGFC